MIDKKTVELQVKIFTNKLIFKIYSFYLIENIIFEYKFCRKILFGLENLNIKQKICLRNS